MQLWKKNYLITLAVFTLFLSVGISLLVNLIFFEEYQQEIQNTMTEKNTLLSLLSLDETSFSENGSLYFLSDNLKNDGKYLLIASKNSRELVNSFPFSLKSFPDSASVYRHEGVPYLVLADTLDLGQNTLDFLLRKGSLLCVHLPQNPAGVCFPGFSASHFFSWLRPVYHHEKKFICPSTRSLMNCAIP